MPSLPTSGLRVFVSYSSEDRRIFEAVCSALEGAGVRPWSDVDLQPGARGFTEQIQTNIRHSHVFVPILTPRSHVHGWVHQEVGFAVAMKVPYVPICVGELPAGMIAMSHAVTVDESLASLDGQVKAVRFDDLVEEAGRQSAIYGETGLEPDDRAQMIESYAKGARKAIGLSCVRTRGGRSSFSIPDEDPDHPVWSARAGSNLRSHHSCELLRRERQALAEHARAAGLRMIVNLGATLEVYGPGVERTRLCILMAFLESLSLPDDQVQIVLVPTDEPRLMLTVGDWFVAESLAPRPVRGVLQTVFTAHAPTVRRRIAEFDRRLASLLAEQRVAPEDSRRVAVERLRSQISGLPKHPAWSCD